MLSVADTPAPPIVSDASIYLVSDQGFGTGIGVYTLNLLRLLNPVLPNLKLISLDCLDDSTGDHSGVVRLPGMRCVRHRLEVPLALRHNRKVLREAIPRSSLVHDCGADYSTVRMFDRSIATVHDYYLRVPRFASMLQPIVLARDAEALFYYLTLARRIRTASGVVVPTAHVQWSLRDMLGMESTAIHHWVDFDRFHPREQREARATLGLPADSKLILNVGAGSSNKNLRLLRMISSSLPKGYGLLKLGSAIPGAPDRVLHIPYIRSADYPLVFNAADVYIHPSFQEGFGIPLIEAMSSGLPIVALDTPVAREVAGTAARYLAREESISAWVSAIIEGTNSRKAIEQKGQVERCLRRFSPSRARHAYVEVYRRAYSL